ATKRSRYRSSAATGRRRARRRAIPGGYRDAGRTIHRGTRACAGPSRRIMIGWVAALARHFVPKGAGTPFHPPLAKSETTIDLRRHIWCMCVDGYAVGTVMAFLSVMLATALLWAVWVAWVPLLPENLYLPLLDLGKITGYRWPSAILYLQLVLGLYALYAGGYWLVSRGHARLIT